MILFVTAMGQELKVYVAVKESVSVIIFVLVSKDMEVMNALKLCVMGMMLL